jgi:hypothetical protein
MSWLEVSVYTNNTNNFIEMLKMIIGQLTLIILLTANGILASKVRRVGYNNSTPKLESLLHSPSPKASAQLSKMLDHECIPDFSRSGITSTQNQLDEHLYSARGRWHLVNRHGLIFFKV